MWSMPPEAGWLGSLSLGAFFLRLPELHKTTEALRTAAARLLGLPLGVHGHFHRQLAPLAVGAADQTAEADEA